MPRSGRRLSLVALTSQEVRGIEAALRRLAAGDFGRCSDCWGEICRRAPQSAAVRHPLPRLPGEARHRCGVGVAGKHQA